MNSHWVPEEFAVVGNYPNNEYSFFDIIEQLGEMRFHYSHAVSHGRAEPCPEDEKRMFEAQRFWANEAARECNFVPMEECPRVTHRFFPGEATDEFYQKYNPDEPKICPFPPSGKMWYWNWYHMLKEYDETVQPEMRQRKEVDHNTRFPAFKTSYLAEHPTIITPDEEILNG